jgi:Kef-type K+ transport system membrane component KefB
MSLESILLAFVLILTGAKLMGQLFRAMGQSPVLGELLAGAIIGPSALGWLPKHEFLTLLSEIGLIILLFELGLQTDISQLARVGRYSAVVAVLGVFVPFVGGMLLGQAFGLETSASLLVGATFCATSIGVTAAILKDQGEQQSVEGQIVLGAAFLDDIIGLLLLSVVMASVGGSAGHGAASSAPPGGLWGLVTITLGFPLVAIVLGTQFAPVLLRWVDLLSVRGALGLSGLVFAFLLSALALMLHTSPVIGAFAAGLVLAKTERSEGIIQHLQPIADLFTPLFFVIVGSQLRLDLLNPLTPGNLALLGVAVLGTAVAFLGKFVSPYFGLPSGLRKPLIGLAMTPRGEVGLIVAELGRRQGVFNDTVFGVLMLVILFTTFLGPVCLRAWLNGQRASSSAPV